MTNQQNIIVECEESVVDSCRPRLNPARQNLRNGLNGGPCYRSRKNFEDNSSFTFGCRGTEPALRAPHLRGCTKDLRTGEIILKSDRLFSEHDKNSEEKYFTQE